MNTAFGSVPMKRALWNRACVMIAMVATLIAACPLISFAAWGPDPVTVKSTSARIPQIASCSDGGYGTFVAWQEESTPGSGLLLAQHLLADGTIDPDWPASGAVASSALSPRPYVQAIPDDLGGMFVLWTDANGFLALTRIGSSGHPTAGWPAEGEFIGYLGPGARPSAVSDGAHGLLLAWGDGGAGTFMHFGPDTTEENLLGASSTPFGALGASYRVLWPCVALSPDGGAFIACAFAHIGASSTSGEWRLNKLSASGLRAVGWPLAGRSFGTIDLTGIAGNGATPGNASLIDVCADGNGGVFAYVGAPTYDPYWHTVSLDQRVFRLTSSGSLAANWPASGYPVPGYSSQYEQVFADQSMRAVSAGTGTAIISYNVLGTEGLDETDFWSCHGSSCGPMGGVFRPGHELALGSGGSAWAAYFSPDGPRNYWDYSAFVGAQPMPSGTGWHEQHDQLWSDWYGDVSIAPAGDGGSVLFWSQVNVLYGLFARRLGLNGEITAVSPPTPSSLVLAEARFVRGAGVRARLGAPGISEASVELFDAAGRRRARASVAGGGVRELTLPGTSALSDGVYFLRARAGEASATSRVVVLR